MSCIAFGPVTDQNCGLRRAKTGTWNLMMRTRLIILLLTLVMAGGSQVFAATGSLTAPDTPPQAFAAQGGGKSQEQAIEQVRRQYGGRIVSAETRREGNREVHYIKVLTSDGTVKTVTVQGRSL